MARTPRARYADDATVLFLADLHLDPARPGMLAAFHAFCSGPARAARAVYILGDLFEVWIGDDDDEAAWAAVAESLAGLVARGIAVHFQAGNRDFLVGERFLGRCGAIGLDDIEVIELGGRRTVLCHGDTLCTDDSSYQAFRAQVRDPAWQRDFLARPLAERRAFAAGLREDSGRAMASKTPAEMDVNPDALRALCREQAADRVIHGHTHRPVHDRWSIDGRAVDRWVLADWFDRGSYLYARDGTLTSVPLDD